MKSLFILLSSAVWAQENSDIMLIDPVIVTASRVEEQSFSAPFQVDSIDEGEVFEKAIRSLPEAFEQTPGVVVQKTAHGQGSPFIRGLTGYHNLYLIDGIRLNNAAFRSGPNQYANTVDVFGLSSVELVKSQGSVLYGSDAVGGTVQSLTKSPIYSESGELFTGRSYSRYSTAENSFVQRGELSYGVKDQWGLLIGGTYKDFGNIEAAELGELPFTGYDEWAGDAKLEIYLNPDNKITFFYQQLEINDAWRVHRTIHSVPFAGSTVGNERSRILDQKRSLGYIQLEGITSSLLGLVDKYKLTLSYQKQEEQRNRVRSGGRRDIQGFDLDSYGINLQLEKEIGAKYLTYGASYYLDEANTFRNDFNSDGSFNQARLQGPFGDDANYHLGAVFANLSLPVGDRIEVDLGARGTYAKADIGTVVDPGTGNPFSINEDWANIVGSARFSYRLDQADQYRLFGGISQAFRAPNFSDLSRLDTNRSSEIETPSPGLAPEEILTFEIGAKAQTDRFSGTISYFYSNLDELIIRTPTGRIVDEDQEVIKQNSPGGHIQGIELDLSWKLSSDWTLFGGFAYHGGEVASFPTSDPIIVKEYPTRIMPTNGFAGIRWDSPDNRFWVEVIGQIVDKADRLNTRDRRDTQRIPPGGTPGHTKVSLRSGWRITDNAHLTASVENIFDEAYRAHGSGQNEPGRNFIFGLEVTF